jgi:chaperonin cofactor prefoldin
MAEKEEVETALEQEKESREMDKERWREQMTEVEQGVSGIIAGLEQKLQAAENGLRRNISAG